LIGVRAGSGLRWPGGGRGHSWCGPFSGSHGHATARCLPPCPADAPLPGPGRDYRTSSKAPWTMAINQVAYRASAAEWQRGLDPRSRRHQVNVPVLPAASGQTARTPVAGGDHLVHDDADGERDKGRGEARAGDGPGGARMTRKAQRPPPECRRIVIRLRYRIKSRYERRQRGLEEPASRPWLN
jgi:hypothetical protein